MFEAGGVPPLVKLLALQPPQPISEKAAWALSNLTAGSSPSQEVRPACGLNPPYAGAHTTASTGDLTVPLRIEPGSPRPHTRQLDHSLELSGTGCDSCMLLCMGST